MTLPSRTVTFLFTDIEGSTKLWEHYPEAMRSALARHDSLLNEIITAHHGHVFKTLGDGLCAAFAIAPDALAAALTAQLTLICEDWQIGRNLRVRMALHTGAVEQRDGDYFGQPLNRVARLLPVGHGGQILLSNVTQELMCDTLPPRSRCETRANTVCAIWHGLSKSTNCCILTCPQTFLRSGRWTTQNCPTTCLCS